jgi:hypothetical protein
MADTYRPEIEVGVAGADVVTRRHAATRGDTRRHESGCGGEELRAPHTDEYLSTRTRCKMTAHRDTCFSGAKKSFGRKHSLMEEREWSLGDRF